MFDLSHVLAHLESGDELIYRDKRGIIEIAGRDAQDFLQRMSTNNVANLKNGSCQNTAFTNNKGRIVDYASIIAQENRFLVVSSHKDAKDLIDWLSNFHFIEDLSMRDVSQEFSLTVSLTRSRKEGAIFWRAAIGEVDVNFIIDLDGNVDGITINDEQYECLRIAALLPRYPQEINDNYMPQNLNLLDSISDDKGCYIGQEVIAKAITYQRNVKNLCGVHLDNDDLKAAIASMTVVSKSGARGIVTSVAPHYSPGLINVLVMDSGQMSSNIHDNIPVFPDFQKKS